MKDNPMGEKTEKLERSRKMLLKLMREAEEEASNLCNEGDFINSEKMHKVAAHLRLAYAEARGLGGNLTVMSGTS